MKKILLTLFAALTISAQAASYTQVGVTNCILLGTSGAYSTNGWLVTGLQILNTSTNAETYNLYDYHTATNVATVTYFTYASTNYIATNSVTNFYIGSSGTSSNIWTNITSGVYTYPSVTNTTQTLPALLTVVVPASTTVTYTGLRAMFSKGCVLAGGTGASTNAGTVVLSYSPLR